jgi:hypothetical protein
VVSLIRGVYRRLKMVMANLPEEFLKWVLNKISTVTEFNSAFAHLQRTIEVVDPMISGILKPKYPELMICSDRRRICIWNWRPQTPGRD